MTSNAGMADDPRIQTIRGYVFEHSPECRGEYAPAQADVCIHCAVIAAAASLAADLAAAEAEMARRGRVLTRLWRQRDGWLDEIDATKLGAERQAQRAAMAESALAAAEARATEAERREMVEINARQTINELLHAARDERDRAVARANTLAEENGDLRDALRCVFLDPLASHGARALARNVLGVPFIVGATPEEMLSSAALGEARDE